MTAGGGWRGPTETGIDSWRREAGIDSVGRPTLRCSGGARQCFADCYDANIGAKKLGCEPKIVANTFAVHGADLISKSRRDFVRYSNQVLKGEIYASHRVSSRPLFCDRRARTIAEQEVANCESLLRTNHQRIRPADVRDRFVTEARSGFRETRVRAEARRSIAVAQPGYPQAFHEDHDAARQKAAQVVPLTPEAFRWSSRHSPSYRQR